MFSSSKRIKGSIVKTKGLGGSSLYKSAITVEEAYNTTCLDFGGTNEYATRADAAAHDFTTALSISHWVKASGAAGFGVLLAKADFGSANISYYTFKDGPACAVVLSNTGNTDLYWKTSITAFDDTWHHVVFSYGASALKIYVDGVEDTAPTKVNDTMPASLKNVALGLEMGRVLNSGATASPYTGKLCSVSLWSKALSQAEVSELYNGGITTDVSTHSAYAASCVSWYKAGDGDSNAANGIVDTKGALHLTPTNMEAGDIGFADAP